VVSFRGTRNLGGVIPRDEESAFRNCLILLNSRSLAQLAMTPDRLPIRNFDEQPMATTIGEFCNREVIITTADMTVSAAARLMRQHHVGSIVVVDGKEGGTRTPVGLVTDRDLVVEVLATGLDPNVITVGDIMAPELVTALEGEGLFETMEVMRHKGVRRLPIVGNDRRLIGIVAVDDLLEVVAEQLRNLTTIIAREQSREATQRQ